VIQCSSAKEVYQTHHHILKVRRSEVGSTSTLTLSLLGLAAVTTEPLFRQLLLGYALTMKPLLLAKVVLAHHHLSEGWLTAVTVGWLILVEVAIFHAI